MPEAVGSTGAQARGRSVRPSVRSIVGLVAGIALLGAAGGEVSNLRAQERADVGVPPPSTASPRSPSVPSAAGALPHQGWSADAPEPVGVVIPAIGVAAPVVRLGLRPDGSLETPDEDYRQAGWWSGGSAPGEPGPTVIVGHVDDHEGPAVFFRLSDLRPGHEVQVTGADGSVSRFVVEAVGRYPKDEFPTDAVYGPATGSSLRLVTCGGDFDRRRKSYEDNVVAFARPAERRTAHLPSLT